MQTLTDMNWLLSVGVFLPMLGVLVMLFIPRSDEALVKTVGIVTAGATLAIGIVTLVNFDYGESQKLQFFVNAEWIPVIHSNYTVGLDGISLPLYFLSMAVTFLVMIYSWDNMPDAGQSQGVLHPDARAADRYGRHVRRPGPHLVLRVLRARVAADVLHDRRVGR